MFGGQISGDRKCSRCPTKAAVVNIVQILQIQQARIIFNPLTDIFTKCFLFCFILISWPLQDLNFVRKELKVIMEDPLMFSKCQFLVKNSVLIFWGNPHGVPVNSEYSQELCQLMNDFGFCDYLPHFLSSKIWSPNVELSFHQVYCSCQNLSCIPAASEELICRKVCLNDFDPLLRSIVSTWIHIGVIIISQACCLHYLKNMEKDCKTQLWDEKQNRALFLGHPVHHFFVITSIISHIVIFFTT